MSPEFAKLLPSCDWNSARHVAAMEAVFWVVTLAQHRLRWPVSLGSSYPVCLACPKMHDLRLRVTPPSNQSTKLTALLRDNSSVFATTPWISSRWPVSLVRFAFSLSRTPAVKFSNASRGLSPSRQTCASHCFVSFLLIQSPYLTFELIERANPLINPRMRKPQLASCFTAISLFVGNQFVHAADPAHPDQPIVAPAEAVSRLKEGNGRFTADNLQHPHESSEDRSYMAKNSYENGGMIFLGMTDA